MNTLNAAGRYEANCRMLLDALKGAKRGNWEDADRLLTLDALGGELAPTERLIDEFSTHVFGNAQIGITAPAHVLVTRIEIEPGEIGVMRVTVGTDVLLGTREQSPVPARSLRLGMVRMMPGIALVARLVEPPEFSIRTPTLATLRAWGVFL
jgi:hypothetical protein